MFIIVVVIIFRSSVNIIYICYCDDFILNQ